MSTRDKLTIEMELDRLHRQSERLGLTAEDVQKLERLIKARALLEGQPTSISKSVSSKELSNEELMKQLESADDKE